MVGKSNNNPPLIHVIPHSTLANDYQGSYKDVISRVRFFEHKTEYSQVIIKNDSPEHVLKAIETNGPVSRIFIEYSHFPKTLGEIRRKHPKTFITVRAHNIEPLQHFDNHGWVSRSPFWVVYGMLRLFLADIFCKRYADIIYPISDYELQFYWKKLPGRARVKWLPYYCPDYLVENSIGEIKPRRIVACLPTSQKNRKSWDLVTRFILLAEASSLHGYNLEFVATGDLKEWGLPKSSHVKFIGMIDDLRTFLPNVIAVAVLSPLGYGFKTTIGDAIANGCYVLVHPVVQARSPGILHQSTIPVDTNNLNDLDIHLKKLFNKLPDPSINPTLKEINLNILKHDFSFNN